MLPWFQASYQASLRFGLWAKLTSELPSLGRLGRKQNATSEKGFHFCRHHKCCALVSRHEFCDGLDVFGKTEQAARPSFALRQTPVVATKISNTEAGLRPVQNVLVGETPAHVRSSLSLVLQAAVPRPSPTTQAEITASGSNCRHSPAPSVWRQGTRHRSFRRRPELLHMHHPQRCDSAGLLLWLRLAVASSSAWSCRVRGCRQGCTFSATQAQQEGTLRAVSGAQQWSHDSCCGGFQ